MRSTDVRYHEMDALRASAMFLGIVYHTVFTFTVALKGNYFCWDSAAHVSADWIDAALHGFRMELYYVIGGFFGHLVYRRYGLFGFIKNRGGRILRPFLIAAALFVVIFHYLCVYAVHLGTAPTWWPTGWTVMPAYLWFLFYMVMMDTSSILLVLLGRVINFERLLAKLDRGFAWLVKSPVKVFLLALLSAAILSTEPDLPFFDYIPKWGWLAYYISFFGFGWFLYRQVDLRFTFGGASKWWHLGIGAAVFAPMFLLEDPHQTWQRLLQHYLACLYAWSMTFAALGFFVQYLANSNGKYRYIADSSYWTYLVHWPVLTFLQITFARSTLPGALKVLFFVGVVEVVALVTYRYFVRYTFIGTTLNGKRERPTSLVLAYAGAERRVLAPAPQKGENP